MESQGLTHLAPVEDAGDEAIDRLLIEPVLATKYLPAPDATVLDIGSGGGSPAIPMKLAAPGISLRMVESKTRKAAFLREVVRTLELDRTAVEAVRFEELLVAPDAARCRRRGHAASRARRPKDAGRASIASSGLAGLLFLFGTAAPTAPELAGAASRSPPQITFF